MKLKTTLLALFCSVQLIFAMSVEFMDDQVNNQSNTGVRLRINNVGGKFEKNVEIRYYFHLEQNKNPQIDVYYAPGTSVSIKQSNSQMAYVEILADSVPSGYFPNQGGMSMGLHYSDWSPWNKSLDRSYKSSSSFEKNDNIALLLNGSEENVIAENNEPVPKPVLPNDGYSLNNAVQNASSGDSYPDEKIRLF